MEWDVASLTDLRTLAITTVEQTQPCRPDNERHKAQFLCIAFSYSGTNEAQRIN